MRSPFTKCLANGARALELTLSFPPWPFRTWKKLSPEGQQAALGIAPSLPVALQEIMQEAIA